MAGVLAYLRGEEASAAAEYAMIIAIVGAAVAASMLFLGTSIAESVNNSASCIKSGTASNC